MNNNNNKSGNKSDGIGFFGLLTLLFIGLKLTGHITWSWFWVLSPAIFSLSIIIVIAIIAIVTIILINVFCNK